VVAAIAPMHPVNRRSIPTVRKASFNPLSPSFVLAVGSEIKVYSMIEHGRLIPSKPSLLAHASPQGMFGSPVLP
jgi:hypothetical protein